MTNPIRVYVDSTGLHSGGLCLDEAGRSETDVKGLLQLGLLLIFSDEIIISGCEIDKVAKRSRELRDTLIAAGFEEDSIRVAPNLEVYKKALQDASIMAIEDLQDGLEASERDPTGLTPPVAPGDEADQAEFLGLIKNQASEHEYQNKSADFLAQKAGGVTKYMVAYSAELRQMLRRLLESSGSWTSNRTLLLETYLRYCSNVCFSRQLDAKYVPATARAEIVREQNAVISQQLLQNLGRELDDIVTQIRGRPLPLPAVANALVQKSRGRPSDLLKSAYEMRSAAVPFRKWMRSAWHDFESDPQSAEDAIIDMRQHLEFALGLKAAPRIGSAFDINIGLMPSVRINWGTLRNALHAREMKGKISVLTEVSRLGKRFDDNRAYEKLVQNSTRRARS